MIIQDNLGKEVFVEKVYGRSKMIDDTFDNKIGIIMFNNEDEEDKHYEYMVYFHCINNSFLCEGNHEIEAYTFKDNPEYFL